MTSLDNKNAERSISDHRIAYTSIRRIVLLAHNLSSAGGLSVGRNIVATLPAIAPKHQYFIIIPAGCGYPVFDNAPNVQVFECPTSSLTSRFIWERVAMPRMIHDFKPDWIWALGNRPIAQPPCRQSLLFHNAHRLYSVQSLKATKIRGRIFKRLSDIELRHGLRWVNQLYCQTEVMRQRFSQVLGYPKSQIGLCPNAFSPMLKPTQIWPEELAKVHGKFILFALTRYYSHKNLEIIVETMSRFPNKLKEVACVLTIDKTQGLQATNLINRIHALSLDDQIVCVGTIPQKRLGAFYNASDVLILPTLLESFSGTYLEAMQLETPILTSDRDFAHEVCGNAAVYVDPLSPTAIMNAILKLKEDSLLRSKLISEGKKRLQQHIKTWPEILENILCKEGVAF